VRNYSWTDSLVPWAEAQDVALCQQIWAEHAPELARWTMQHLVIRDDAYCRYTAEWNPELEQWTRGVTTVKGYGKQVLTLAVLEKHYRGKNRNSIMGPHIAVPQLGPDDPPSGLTRQIAFDIDNHGSAWEDPIKNHRYALRLFDQALETCEGWRGDQPWIPLLTDSNGKGGFHLRVFWDEPIPVAEAHAFAAWLCRDHEEHGLTKIEIYPKQQKASSFTHFLRLPGHHHTLQHWSRIWNGVAWLDGLAAVQQVLRGTPLVRFEPTMEAAPVPAVASARPVRPSGPGVANKPATAKTLAEAPTDFTTALARDALAAYSCEHLHNDEIFKVGAALSHLGDAGFDVWMEWLNAPAHPYWRAYSDNREKYTEAYWVAMWDRFQNGQAYNFTLGTVFYLAEQAGWDRQARSKVIFTKLRGRRVRQRAKELMRRSQGCLSGDTAPETRVSQPPEAGGTGTRGTRG
jgi:hypothetical protein